MHVQEQARLSSARRAVVAFASALHTAETVAQVIDSPSEPSDEGWAFARNAFCRDRLRGAVDTAIACKVKVVLPLDSGP